MEDPGQQVCQVHLIEYGPVFFDKPHIILCFAAPERVGFQVVHKSLIQCAAFGDGICFYGGDPGPAHAPPWLVDGPQEADIIRVVDHSQVAQHILDFFPLVELHTGIEHIGDLIADQGLLQSPGYIVGPVEDPHRGIGDPLLPLMESPHIGSDPVCLQRAGLGMEIQGLPVARLDRNQFFLQPLPVFVDKGIGGRQNLRGGPIVPV